MFRLCLHFRCQCKVSGTPAEPVIAEPGPDIAEPHLERPPLPTWVLLEVQSLAERVEAMENIKKNVQTALSMASLHVDVLLDYEYPSAPSSREWLAGVVMRARNCVAAINFAFAHCHEVVCWLQFLVQVVLFVGVFETNIHAYSHSTLNVWGRWADQVECKQLPYIVLWARPLRC